MKKLLSILIIMAVLLSGCSILEDPVTVTTTTATLPNTNKPPVADAAPVEVDFAKTDGDMFTDRDSEGEYSEDKAVIIQLSGDSVTCNSAAVKVEGTTVTIAKKGTYILRGTLTDGSVIVSASDNDKVQIVLDGVEIHSASSAALQVTRGDKVFLTLAEGSENTLSNGGSFPDTVDGAVFSKQDLSINGEGSLTVESPAGHGIVCKDDLVITGGSYTIHAASHGVDVNDSFRIKGGSIKVDAGKDGVHAEDNEDTATGFVYISGGELDIKAEGDGISAALTMQISGGTIGILAGGGYENGPSHSNMGGGPGGMGGRPSMPPYPRASVTPVEETDTSMKGLKSQGGLLIGNGTISIDSADDGIHSNTVTVINGGTIQIASGDDAIHADTDLTITAGTVDISAGYEGLEAVNVRVIGGNISMITTDDGINAAGGTDGSGERSPSNGSIVIDGGDLYIQSSGDGMDANGYLEINGGKTVVCGPNSGDTATLDFDLGGTINGGIFIGTGSSFMAQTFSGNQQGVLAIQAGESSGAAITVTDRQGNVLLAHQPKLDFSVFIFSAPELVAGQTYHITIGDTEGDIEAY